jgi:4-hydroxyphenylacetate 3-monooxygenase
MSYGWIGRTPDYKAAWVATLAAASHVYGEYQPNAKRWYDFACRKIPFINHSIVNPPVDRHIPDASSDVFIRVDKETDKGIIVSGAKVVATTAALTHYTFVAHYNVAIREKKYSPVFIAHLGTPGIKIISRNSYEYNAAVTASPFDAPLSSRMDENDAILVFDKALIPWENVLMYDVDSANGFVAQTGFMGRALLHSCTRFAVKLDFISGLFIKAVEITGTKDFRGVQAAVGEVIGLRHVMWSLSDAMARTAEPWGEYVLPNFEAALAFRMLAGDAASRVRNLIQKTVASGLIYLPSTAGDFLNPAIRPYLDKYVRGSNGIGAEERVKTLKLLWDCVNSEFASRHELYEINYAGSNEQTRVDPYVLGNITGRTAEMKAFADQCMSEYDLKGWTVPDLINPDDVSTIRRAWS